MRGQQIKKVFAYRGLSSLWLHPFVENDERTQGVQSISARFSILIVKSAQLLCFVIPSPLLPSSFPSLDRFPISKPQLAEQWVRSLNRKNFVPTTNSCLCSEHFQLECFRDYNGKPFLREDAVPTIFKQVVCEKMVMINIFIIFVISSVHALHDSSGRG